MLCAWTCVPSNEGLCFHALLRRKDMYTLGFSSPPSSADGAPYWGSWRGWLAWKAWERFLCLGRQRSRAGHATAVLCVIFGVAPPLPSLLPEMLEAPPTQIVFYFYLHPLCLANRESVLRKFVTVKPLRVGLSTNNNNKNICRLGIRLSPDNPEEGGKVMWQSSFKFDVGKTKAQQIGST